MAIGEHLGNTRQHPFKVIDGGRTAPTGPPVEVGLAPPAADAADVVQDLAVARRRLHPEEPELWIAPSFPATPDGG